MLHVAGTNGKGSTCAFAASCLRQAGYRVGLYTSPHLLRVNERFQVDGEEISDELLGRRILEVLERHPPALERPSPLTYFELGTVVALWHFAQEKVDVAVLETGLGGRLDATAAVTPSVAAITSISLDHTEHLGHTLAAIAREKAGIMKPGVPAVSSRQDDEALRVLEATARELEVPLWLEGRDFALEPETGGSPGLSYRGPRRTVRGLRLSLVGPHQLQNAAVALAALDQLEAQGVRLTDAHREVGLATTRWPGRVQAIAGTPTVVLDGAHNPAGASALRAALDSVYADRRVHLVFGVLADKDWRPMLRALFPRCASAHLAPVDSPRNLPPASYLEEALLLCRSTRAHLSAHAALAAALAEAGPEDLVVCAGSLYLIGQLRAAYPDRG